MLSGDRADRLKLRASDGLRPEAPSSGNKSHQPGGQKSKEEATEDFTNFTQNQWIALELKMKKENMKMLSIENYKDKDLSYNKRKVAIIYYFKKNRLGWLQGKIHARTQGSEALEFNWICDFSKIRKAFRLDDDLYVTNKGISLLEYLIIIFIAISSLLDYHHY